MNLLNRSLNYYCIYLKILVGFKISHSIYTFVDLDLVDNRACFVLIHASTLEE